MSLYIAKDLVGLILYFGYIFRDNIIFYSSASYEWLGHDAAWFRDQLTPQQNWYRIGIYSRLGSPWLFNSPADRLYPAVFNSSEPPVLNDTFLFSVNFDSSANRCVYLLWPCDLHVSTSFRQNTSIKIVSNISKYDAYYRCQNLTMIACCQIPANTSMHRERAEKIILSVFRPCLHVYT